MKSDKIKKFMTLAGQRTATNPEKADEKLKILAAQLLLSETIEYVNKGLGINLRVGKEVIADQNDLTYEVHRPAVDKLEMLDGLADVAYTMYWNMEAFGLKLEEAFNLVCDNNLEKFVLLKDWSGDPGVMTKENWHCNQKVEWPKEVVSVEVVQVEEEFYAVGKDSNGKVRKPSTYQSVNLKKLL